MNRKGQMNGVGPILIAAIVIIAALALLPTIFQSIGDTTLTRDIANVTKNFTGTIVLEGQAISGVSITNSSGGEVVPTSNYSITNYDASTGTLRAYITPLAGTYTAKNVNISYTYEPLGYAKESSTRAIIPLIAIFAALAVAVVALVPAFRREVMDLIKR